MAIKHLPTELISNILEYEDINIKDVINVSATCKHFRYTIINNNNLWRKKFCQRWPTAKENYEKMGNSLYHTNILDVKSGMKCAKELRDYVSHMSERHYRYSDNYKYSKDFYSLFLTSKHCLDAHLLHSAFLEDELIRIAYAQPAWQCDLTQRYYSIRLLRCLITRNFTIKKKQFKRKPYQQQILEQMFTIIIQWCHPEKYIYYLHVDKFLDDIMQEVLTHLKEETPTHTIFLLSPEQISFWKHNNINKNYWGEIEARQIKCILDKIIFNFYCLHHPWKFYEKSNLIDLITEKVLWLITYTCVARRMGIYVEIAQDPSQVNFFSDEHFLTWKPRDHTEKTECFTFDWKFYPNISPFIRKCPLISNSLKMSTKQLINEVAKVLKNDIPSNFFSYSEIIVDTMLMCGRIDKYKRRSRYKIKFAVGMVIRYKHSESEDSKDGVGVIYGWHIRPNQRCRCRYHSPRQLDDTRGRLHYLEPFYTVLTDDGGRVVSQSAITSVCTSMDVQWIDNPEVGRYFCRFERNYYIPNNMLHRQYPQDAAFVRETFNNL